MSVWSSPFGVPTLVGPSLRRSLLKQELQTGRSPPIYDAAADDSRDGGPGKIPAVKGRISRFRTRLGGLVSPFQVRIDDRDIRD